MTKTQTPPYHPFTEVRFRATVMASSLFGRKVRQVAEAAVADLVAKGYAAEPLFCHVFDFEGEPVAIATQIDTDGQGIFVEYDIGYCVPRRTITVAEMRQRAKEKADRLLEEARSAFKDQSSDDEDPDAEGRRPQRRRGGRW